MFRFRAWDRSGWGYFRHRPTGTFVSGSRGRERRLCSIWLSRQPSYKSLLPPHIAPFFFRSSSRNSTHSRFNVEIKSGFIEPSIALTTWTPLSFCTFWSVWVILVFSFRWDVQSQLQAAYSVGKKVCVIDLSVPRSVCRIGSLDALCSSSRIWNVCPSRKADCRCNRLGCTKRLPMKLSTVDCHGSIV